MKNYLKLKVIILVFLCFAAPFMYFNTMGAAFSVTVNNRSLQSASGEGAKLNVLDHQWHGQKKDNSKIKIEAGTQHTFKQHYNFPYPAVISLKLHFKDSRNDVIIYGVPLPGGKWSISYAHEPNVSWRGTQWKAHNYVDNIEADYTYYPSDGGNASIEKNLKIRSRDEENSKIQPIKTI